MAKSLDMLVIAEGVEEEKQVTNVEDVSVVITFRDTILQSRCRKKTM